MIVIYHANCPDGFAAALAVWMLHPRGHDATYIPAQYGQAPPDVTDREVYIVDFSYPRDVLLGMHARAEKLTVIDHHKTAQAALEGLDFCHFDMAKSGAVLTWEHLSPAPVPSFFKYIQDRDLWQWKRPNSKEISAYIASLPRDFSVWAQAVDAVALDLSRVVASGAAVLRAQERYIESMQAHVRMMPVYVDGARSEVPLVNTTYCHSELIGSLAEGQPFAVGWFQRGDGEFVYSLRSRGAGGMDVSAIAKQHGGGGHRNAAGFTSNELLASITVMS